MLQSVWRRYAPSLTQDQADVRGAALSTHAAVPARKVLTMPSPRPPLTPDQKRIRMLTLSLPLLVATSYVLYRRLVLGEEQRKLKPGQKIAARPA